MREPGQRLADAYRSVGAAISELRSTPIRRHSGGEETLHVGAAQRYLLEAQADLDTALSDLGRPRIIIGSEPTRQGALRFLNRPSLYAQIGELHALREKIGRELAELQRPCPDDLPEGDPFERLSKSLGFRDDLIAASVVAISIILGGIAFTLTR